MGDIVPLRTNRKEDVINCSLSHRSSQLCPLKGISNVMETNRNRDGSKPAILPMQLIGEFQFEVLRQVETLGRSAYGVNIRIALQDEMGREVHTPQVYAALVRLEELGFITSSIDRTASAGRRGRPRRVYSLEAPGQRMLKAGSFLSSSVPAWEVSNAGRKRPSTA